MNLFELIEAILIEEHLDEVKHLREVSDFTCGTNESLDMFLKCEAFIYNKEGYGNTYLIKERKSGTIVGYYTLRTNSIQAYSEDTNRIEVFPSIELARFAISYSWQKIKFGTLILATFIMKKIIKVKNLVGCNTLMVFVENDDDIIHFYSRFGLGLSKEETEKYILDEYNEGCKLMYVKIDDVNEFSKNFEIDINEFIKDIL